MVSSLGLCESPMGLCVVQPNFVHVLRKPHGCQDLARDLQSHLPNYHSRRKQFMTKTKIKDLSVSMENSLQRESSARIQV